MRQGLACNISLPASPGKIRVDDRCCTATPLAGLNCFIVYIVTWECILVNMYWDFAVHAVNFLWLIHYFTGKLLSGGAFADKMHQIDYWVL